MRIIREANNEFEQIKRVNDMEYFLLKNYPFERGYSSGFICYKTKKNISFDIYFDESKPNRVRTLRARLPGEVAAYALIGNFMSGKGKFPKFTFNSPEQLIQKLESWTNF